MRTPPVTRRLFNAARLCCAAGALGTLGLGCSHLRSGGYYGGANCDSSVRALAASEGSAAPGELAGDPECLRLEGRKLAPGACPPNAGTGCLSCGPGGCGANCPLTSALSGRMALAATAVDAGHAAERAHRPDLAATHYREALLSDPAAAEAHHRLAVLLDRAGTYAAAEQHYAAALTARPGDADLLCDVGYSYLLQGRTEDAEHQFRTALAERPDHLRSLENLGLLYAKQNDRTRAAAVLALTGTKADADAKLAVLFPGEPQPSDLPTSPGMPLWAGVSPAGRVTPASASVPPTAAAPVRTAAISQPSAGGYEMRTTVYPPALDRPIDVTPPTIPPPTAPAGDLPTWNGVAGQSTDLTPAPSAFAPVPVAAPVAAPEEPASEMPLWPPVGGFSRAG